MITPASLSPERQQVITATDSTILLGAVPDGWGTPESVWLDKMGMSKPKKPSLSMFLGHVFEPHIAAHYMGLPEQEAYTMSSPGFLRMAELPFGCTPDGWVEDAIGMAGHGFEAKSTTSRADWGREGTEDIPDRVYIQVQHSMMVADASRWDVGAFFYNKEDKEEIACHVMQYGSLNPASLERFVTDRKFYKIMRNEDMIASIKEAGLSFWETYVVPRMRPTSGEPAPLVVVKPVLKEERDDSYADAIGALIEARCQAKLFTEQADFMAQEIRSKLEQLNTESLIAGNYTAKLTASTRSGKPDFEEAFAVACSRGNLEAEVITAILKTYKKPNAVSYRLDVKESK